MNRLIALFPLFYPMDNAVLDLQTAEQKAFLTNPMRESPYKEDIVQRIMELSLPKTQISRWVDFK